MPIDGHAYLVSQGWGGKGTGLRHGAIARPVTVAQKKTLSGVGKDRDEAFPFWDHIFEAASVNIQVKLHKDDDDSDSADTVEPVVELQRTGTGIISHRRPKTGTPAISEATTPSLSGATTPISQPSGSVTQRISVMALAKQEAARRMLYANFFRGPVIGCDDEDKDVQKASLTSFQAIEVTEIAPCSGSERKRKEGKSLDDAATVTERKRKRSEDVDKRERRRRKRESEEKGNTGEQEAQVQDADDATESEQSARHREKAERKRRKEEKRVRKAEKQTRKEERRRLKDKSIEQDLNTIESEEPPASEAGASNEAEAKPEDEDLQNKRKKRETTASDAPLSEKKARKKRKKAL